MTCTATRHGDRTAYWHGCRCPEAIAAERDYKRQYRKRKYLARGALTVDATGTRRRIRALQALGWPLYVIDGHIGGTPRTGLAWNILTSSAVFRSTAEAVERCYASLSMTPGPSAQTRARALRKGWVPPLAWDDDVIDDPTARPYVAPRRGLRDGWDEARWADVEHLRGFGYTDDQIAARLGIEPDSLRKAIARAAA